MNNLSVIIPGFNTPRVWWGRCLHSVLDCCQTEDEIICVDDGSSLSADLDSFVREDKRVRALFRKNGGLSVARNTGMRIAQGKFLAFVDSDDELVEGILYRCIRKLEECEGDVAVYGVNTIWVNDGLQKIDVVDSEWNGILSPQDIKRLEALRLLNYVCNKVYRRSFLASHSLRFEPKGMPCEDIIFNLRVIMAGGQWCVVPWVGYYYYRTEGTLLSQYRPFNSEGLQLCAETWHRYVLTSQEAMCLFGQRVMLSEASILWAQWDNINRLNSPFNVQAKKKWLESNRKKMLRKAPRLRRKLLERSVGLFLWYSRIYWFLRRYCYVRCIRRWNIRRMYPGAIDYALHLGSRR